MKRIVWMIGLLLVMTGVQANNMMRILEKGFDAKTLTPEQIDSVLETGSVEAIIPSLILC